jgi:hypothetical protein
MDVPALLREFGFPLIVLGALGYFVARSIWPFCKEQIERSQADARAERTQWLALITQLTQAVSTQREASIEALRRQGAQLDEIARVLSHLAGAVEALEKRAQP